MVRLVVCLYIKSLLTVVLYYFILHVELNLH